MKELGGQSVVMHHETGKFAAEKDFDLLLVWGEMADAYREGALEAGMKDNSAIIFESKEELSDYLASIVKDDDVVLVKGSRSMKMEDVVNLLKGKRIG
jgi:UDP-N-acetylmuramoyl-tripeptide--D-alanyl-D-alanine ligase